MEKQWPISLAKNYRSLDYVSFSKQIIIGYITFLQSQYQFADDVIIFYDTL